MSSNLMSVREVANRFGVSTTAVYDWIKKGELEIVTIGKVTKRKFIPEDSVMRFEEKRQSEASSSDTSGGLTPCVAQV
jgi:excisionase family DNA binding protein